MTHASPEQLLQHRMQTIADFFGLGTINSESIARQHGTNEVYAVTTEKGGYIIKIIVNTTIDDIEHSLPYLQRLSEYSYPAAAYYLKAPNGTEIYRSDDGNAVVLQLLPGTMPELTEQVVREGGKYLALLHLVPADGLPPKPHWIDNDFLPTALQEAVSMFGEDKLQETLNVYHSFGDFKPAHFPQSIIHGDLGYDHCLFVGDRLSAFLDWQDIGVTAALLDFAMASLGFCFREADEHSGMWAIFDPQLYTAFYESYTQVRPFTPDEERNILTAIRYAGITQPVWSMLYWQQYHKGQEMVETNLLYWKFGLDTLELPQLKGNLS